MATVSISTGLIEDKVLLHSLYALLAAYPFLGIPPILALVINIVQIFDKQSLSFGIRFCMPFVILDHV